jgi:hypothetical protein
MYLWRRNYPRGKYQPVVCIHGIFYVVKDEIVFKHRYAEWVLPSSMQKHIPYNPRHLPVVIEENECNTHSQPSQVSSESLSCSGVSGWSLPRVSFT